MIKKKYPEEIYPYRGYKTDAFGRLSHWTTCNSDFERAYDRGFEDGRFKKGLDALNPLAGWSNLTEAIKGGARIDWEALDGIEAKCVHPDIGTLTYTMKRDQPEPANTIHGWNTRESMVWEWAFELAWQKADGWSLWVKGDLPLRKLTADQLEPGTCFKGKCMGEVRDCLLYQGRPAYHEVDGEEVGPVSELKVVGVNLYSQRSREGADPNPVNWLASQVEVLEVYGVGTFEKPKEEA